MAVDLRRSTWLSDHLPRETMIELLDTCFEQICPPILAGGGDVLKFIGDGVLAVFPVADDDARRRAPPSRRGRRGLPAPPWSPGSGRIFFSPLRRRASVSIWAMSFMGMSAPPAGSTSR